MAYTGGVSFPQRRAFGKNYSVDPAIAFESERLGLEYANAPGMAIRAEGKRQFDIQTEREQERFEKQQRQQAISGVTSTGLNVAMLRAITKPKGEPFFGTWGKGSGEEPALLSTPSASPFVTTPGEASMLIGGGEGALIGGQASSFPFYSGGTTEAPMLLGGKQAAVGSDMVVGGGTTAGTSSGYMATAGPYAVTAGGGYVGGKAGQYISKQTGVGGKREGGLAGGAAAGAAIGTFIFPGVGTVVGAVIGGAVGWASADQDTWICTAIDKLFTLSDETKKSLSKLRKYAIKNHKKESIPYFKNGSLLVEAINNGKSSEKVYEVLKDSLVEKCHKFIQQNRMEVAYQHYKEAMEYLCEKYNVDLSVKDGG